MSDDEKTPEPRRPEWDAKRRNTWWLKYAGVFGAMAAAITLANTCATRTLGLQTVEAAATAHTKLEEKIERVEDRNQAALDKSLTKVEAALKGLNDRIDNMLAAPKPAPRHRP